MLFNSLDFFLFFFTTFSLYWAIPSRFNVLKNALLLAASYVFYGLWDWRFLGLIALSTLIDFTAARQIQETSIRNKKRFWLWLSICTNIGILGFFKYFNFFAESLASFLGLLGLHVGHTTLNIVLPVGISFYTFQTLSYTVDVYKGRIKATSNLLQFAVFVAFFPQLVAGPIERAANLLPQFKQHNSFSYTQAMAGVALMLWGFFKKIAIADNLGLLIDPVYSNLAAYQNWQILTAGCAFTLQIYADFSGYSDIAIGLAAIFGFTLSTNFKTPFFSTSIQEFWQRWHITLSTWFRDYIYFSLGGNRRGKARWALSILITFGLSGLWHGAGVNFLLFGLWHGLFYIIERKLVPRGNRFLGHVFTLGIIVSGFVFFRISTLSGLSDFYTQLFSFQEISLPEISRHMFLIVSGMAVFYFVEVKLTGYENFAVWIYSQPKQRRYLWAYVLVFALLIIGAFNTGQNFIYFQF